MTTPLIPPDLARAAAGTDPLARLNATLAILRPVPLRSSTEGWTPPAWTANAIELAAATAAGAPPSEILTLWQELLHAGATHLYITRLHDHLANP